MPTDAPRPPSDRPHRTHQPGEQRRAQRRPRSGGLAGHLHDLAERSVTRAREYGPLDRLLTWARLDLDPPHRPPAWWRVALATVLSIVGSLAADAALVAIGTHLFPGTKGYQHFQFADYAKLTVIGVVIAGSGWAIVTRVCAAPRWLFYRLAIVVTLVLFLPDVWIWRQGQSAHGVAVLMVMHVAIALVTYNLLVHVAPVRLRCRPRDADAGTLRTTP